MLKRLLNFLIKSIDVLVIICFAIVVILVFLQVYTRFLTNNSITWADEASRFLMIWMVMLSAVSLYSRHGHVCVEMFVDYFPRSVKKLLIVTGYLLIMAFFCVLISGTSKIFGVTWKQLSPALKIPMGIPYVSVPFCSLLMGILTIRDLIVEILAWKGGYEQ